MSNLGDGLQLQIDGSIQILQYIQTNLQFILS